MSDLYKTDLMRWAGDAHGAGRLDEPRVTATRDNPLCGDRVTMDIRCDAAGHVTDLAQDTRACVLCQASASIVGQAAPGTDAAEVAATLDALRAFLREGGPAPEGRFAALSVFAPVAPHRSRHVCVFLPFEALKEALTARA
ncbi:iron-sulfur cluster assembly scaffold protein [Zavarzinia sp. CC-PAN008]|uniref:iron-sulfur cluster assembly scaffold protein n=1 Tax=Zavarzinia sp. CC-PAN008 TaxID=3243332 RepID=UPI003F742BF8